MGNIHAVKCIETTDGVLHFRFESEISRRHFVLYLSTTVEDNDEPVIEVKRLVLKKRRTPNQFKTQVFDELVKSFQKYKRTKLGLLKKLVDLNIE